MIGYKLVAADDNNNLTSILVTPISGKLKFYRLNDEIQTVDQGFIFKKLQDARDFAVNEDELWECEYEAVLPLPKIKLSFYDRLGKMEYFTPQEKDEVIKYIAQIEESLIPCKFKDGNSYAYIPEEEDWIRDALHVSNIRLTQKIN